MTEDPGRSLEGFEGWMAPEAYDEPKDDLFEDLELWARSGKIRFRRSNQEFFDLLEQCYPIGQNRIDWRGVRPHSVLHVISNRHVSIEFEDHIRILTSFRAAISGWILDRGIDGFEHIVWIGDGCDLSLLMTVSTFLECFPVLFSWPQHHYVLFSQGKWCLNYTMEGQLFFGGTGDATVKGVVDLDAA